jgi:putative two-component system response regulator
MERQGMNGVSRGLGLGDGKLARILLVDSNHITSLALRTALEEDYGVAVATSGGEALRLAALVPRPTLAILGLEVSAPDACETLSLLKSDPATSGIPVIFAAPMLDAAAAERALALGADDFVLMPCSPCVLKLRVGVQIELSRSRARLEALVDERTQELSESRLEVIRRLCRAAEYRDNETGMHVVRMSKYAQIVALAAGASPAKAELVLNAAPMHDIGKIGIPDDILRKAGPLDEAERAVMRRHCEIGAAIVGNHGSGLMRSAAQAAISHHERYDGAGYPVGLSGEAIPWIGRVIALADVFDALTSDRPYKRAWEIDRALDFIRAERGTQFDPELVDAFLGSEPELREIKALYPD